MNTKSNTKKIVLTAMLLAIGALLHQITPAIGLPMQPDMALAMLFIIIILNKDDYKTCLISAIITGIFTAMTTKFPGGQLPNIIDKVVTLNIIYLIIIILLKVKSIRNLPLLKQNGFLIYVILPIGTLISGSIFLLSASFIFGLPSGFNTLFISVVLPSTVLNTVTGIFLFKVVLLSIKRTAFTI